MYTKHSGSVATKGCHCDVFSWPPIFTHALCSDEYGQSLAMAACCSDSPCPTSSSAFEIFFATATFFFLAVSSYATFCLRAELR